MKMKKLYFIPAAMLGLAVAGCSSDDIVVGENQGPQWNSEGKGYVALSLNLPTQASTGMRANDQFDDGEPDEYAVKNATLLLFKGSSETTATLQASYTLTVAGSEIKDPEENDQVTSTVQLTQQINQIDADQDQNKLYALVVLNHNDIFSVDASNQTLKFYDVATAYGANSASTLSLENFMTKVINNGGQGVDASDIYTRNGILMMNAPLASATGAATYSGTVSTLVDVTTGIYTTEREAQENPAASIYVERAVAKVSVTAQNASGSLADAPSTVKDEGQTDVAAWAIQGWMLNNTNTKSYFAHNYPLQNCPWWSYKNKDLGETAGYYRFIGTDPVGAKAGGSLAGYRIYWGGDPNYDVDATTNNELIKINSTYFTTKNVHGLGLDKYDYCFENTFTTPWQNQNQTTQAVIAVQFNGGQDFWTVNGSTSTVYINQKDIDNMVKKAFVNTQAVYDVIEAGLADKKTFDPATDLVVEYDKDAAGVEGNNALNNQAGKWTVKAVRLTASGVSKFDSYLVVDKIVPDDQQFNQEPNRVDNSAYDAGLAAAQALQIECYDQGLAYYPVNIKHFGDDLTPWDADDAEGNVSYPDTDGKAEANWLGRYGVLRNNWYQLDVTNVTNIGYSDVPVITDPDDPVARYISVKINILSWAVRKQSVEL